MRPVAGKSDAPQQDASPAASFAQVPVALEHARLQSSAAGLGGAMPLSGPQATAFLGGMAALNMIMQVIMQQLLPLLNTLGTLQSQTSIGALAFACRCCETPPAQDAGQPTDGADDTPKDDPATPDTPPADQGPGQGYGTAPDAPADTPDAPGDTPDAPADTPDVPTETPDAPADGTHVEEPLRRLFKADYGDGIDAMAGDGRAGPREVSNAVVAATEDRPNAAGATDLFWGWGQFLDHDLSLSEGGDPDPRNIAVPTGDEWFDSEGSGDKELRFNRTPGVTGPDGVREQMNAITPEIDGSNVYGSTPAQETELREGAGGRMLLDTQGNLPRDEKGFYIAGDARVNENPLLTSFHTVFAREHNRLADDIAAQNPDWTDDQIFDAARKINVAQMQAITVNEFLPPLLGPDALGGYDGYQDVDTQISNAFSTAAFRFGHTMVSDQLRYIGADGQVTEKRLMDAFFNPREIDQFGIDAIIRGAASQVAQEMDSELVDSLRNAVMTGPREMRLDLASLNIQRGRDHGLPSLNEMKRALGQEPLTGFDDPRLRDGVGERLAEVYDSIDDVDAWIGMLAERPMGAGMAGETQAAVLVEQFKRSRDGDPDWYQNTFTGAELDQINNTRLSDIIERNMTDTDLQDFAMLSAAHQPQVA